MKKLLIPLILSCSLLLASELNTISPSFDCSNETKLNRVEKLVCKNSTISTLDVVMNTQYNIIIKYDKEIRAKQREWLKNTCHVTIEANVNDDELSYCLLNSYQQKIKTLKELSQNLTKKEFDKNLKTFTKNLLDIQKKSDEIFKQTNSVLKPIIMLETSGIEHIIDKKPDSLTDEEYSSLLYDYAYYKTLRINTDIYKEDILYFLYLEDLNFIWYKKDESFTPNDREYLELSIKVLNNAIKLTPNDAKPYKLLGQNYYKLYIFAWMTLNWTSSYGITEPRFDRIAPYIKNAYMKYVELCKQKNIKPELDEVEQAIVDRQRVFIEIFSTFNESIRLAKATYSFEKYKKYRINDPKYKNICKEYVAMLNRMPDNNLTECSRYVNEDNSEFEYVKYDDAPDDLKEFTIPDKDYRNKRYSFLFKYKDRYFIDGFKSFSIANGLRDEEGRKYDICEYDYVDFSKEEFISYDDTCIVDHYDLIYKNTKE